MARDENDLVVFEDQRYKKSEKISIPAFGCLNLNNPVFFCRH
jgi:hypothetical protein